MGRERKSNSEFIKQCDTTIFTPLEVYIDAFTKIKVRCKLCGSVSEKSPSNILNIHHRVKKCVVCASHNQILIDNGEYLEIDISTKKIKNAVMLIDKTDWECLQGVGIGRICQK